MKSSTNNAPEDPQYKPKREKLDAVNLRLEYNEIGEQIRPSQAFLRELASDKRWADRLRHSARFGSQLRKVYDRIAHAIYVLKKKHLN